MTTISGRIRIGKSDSNEVSSKFGGYTLAHTVSNSLKYTFTKNTVKDIKSTPFVQPFPNQSKTSPKKLLDKSPSS